MRLQLELQDADDCQASRTTTKYPSQSKEENRSVFEVNHVQGRSVLIVAAFRTGSTFISQLFNQNKDVLYLFEPLRLVQDMTRANVITSDLQNSSQLETLSDLYHCRFTSQYVHHMRTWAMVSTSNDIRRLCHRYKHTSCADITVEDITQTCKNRRHIATKVIRLTSLPVLQALVTQEKLDLKVLHVIRDPRGVASSRKFVYAHDIEIVRNTTIEQAGLVNNLNQYCQHAVEMVKYNKTLPAWLDGRYKLVPYEDTAMDPLGQTESIYKFLGMTVPVEVSLWMSEWTNVTNDKSINNMDTRKNSIEAAQSWRSKLLFQDLKIVQSLDICRELMALMGYKIVKSEDEMRHFAYKMSDE
ncbi:carbohydrate sulfotransferase 1-like [Glandiceps talaboti]